MSGLSGLMLGLAALIAANTAANDQAQGNWGAVAVGPEGVTGTAVGTASKAEAESGANEACGGLCTVGYSFQGGCGAIAISGEEAFAGGGVSRQEAEEQAIGFCQKDFRIDCSIMASACNR